MKNFVLSIFISLTLLPVALAGVFVPYSCRVSNEAPGYCCWAAIETLARAQGIARLYGLKQSRKTDPDGYIQRAYMGTDGQWHYDSFYVEHYGGTIDSVIDKFKRVGYTGYHYQRIGNKDETLILEALARGRGAVVQVDWQDEYGGGIHAIALTGLDTESVTFINSNGCKEERRSRQWFEQNWDGFVITLE